MEGSGVIRSISNFIATCHSNEDLHHSKLVEHLKKQLKIHEASVSDSKRVWEEISHQCRAMDGQRAQTEEDERKAIKEFNELSTRLEELRAHLIHLESSKDDKSLSIAPQTKGVEGDLSLLENLQEQLPQLSRELEGKEKQYQSLSATRRTLEKALVPLRKQNEIMFKDIQDTKARVESEEDTIVRTAERTQALLKSNHILDIENMKLEQRLDAVLQSRGLSRTELARLKEVAKEVDQFKQERNQLQRKHEGLNNEWNEVAQQRERMAEELAARQEESQGLKERHQVSRQLKERLRKELEVKEERLEDIVEQSSLVGRLKRRMEALVHESFVLKFKSELKKTKLDMQKSFIPHVPSSIT